MILYHGSNEIIQFPLLDKGKLYNDYGRGFYCTQQIELAKEWACSEETDGYANQYAFKENHMSILNLSDEKYTILHWLAVLSKNRKIRISTPVMKQGFAWLQEYFYLDVDTYDVIIGYRADDSYFQFARAFLNNMISYEQLSYAMKLEKLGEQIVLKSQKAFNELHFSGAVRAERLKYYVKRKSRDENARNAYILELSKTDTNGIYLLDLLRGDVTLDDSSL